MKNHSYKRPSTKEITNELKRVIQKEEYYKIYKKSISILVVVSIVTVVMFMLYLKLFLIRGDSMSPTLNKGDYVLGIKTRDIKSGDIIAFEKNGKVLIKRVIAVEGEVVNITEDGNVFINDEELKENYVLDKSIGELNIEIPHKVQPNNYFVMGDSRENSIDSRVTLVGDVEAEQIIGKVIFRVWPIF